MQRLLIVGSGDIAARALPLLLPRYRVYCLVRNSAQAAAWRSRGAIPVAGDLDDRKTLARLAGLADLVLHLCPPGDTGDRDIRTRHLLAALRRPSRIVYVSTSGVYGDCKGERVDETRPARPATARAARRRDAERQLRAHAARRGTAVALLRVSGIYAADRLPLARLDRGTPILVPEDDAYINHIHAEDLARVCAAALVRGRPGRVYNVCDDSGLKMGEYLERVAAAFGRPAPRRVRRSEAEESIPASLLSFLDESRRLDNGRMKRELKVRLRYPRVDDGIAAAAQSV